MDKYDEEFFRKLNLQTESLLKFLQECKFSGNLDNKLNINVVIRLLNNYQVITKNLLENIRSLKNENENLKNKKEE